MITPYLQLKVDPSTSASHQSNFLALDAAFGSLLTVYTATLSAGTVTVLNATVPTTSLSRVIFARTTPGGTLGSISAVVNAGTSIVFSSTSSSETSVVSYQVVNSPSSFVLGEEPSLVADASADTQTVPAQIKNY